MITISKRELRAIIVEEYRNYLNEINSRVDDVELARVVVKKINLKESSKPACGGVKGSALYHDENGHFTGKEDAVVRSLKKHKGKNCRHGTTRVRGSNDSIATSLPCGSKKQTYSGGIGKHKKRCKDSKSANEAVEPGDISDSQVAYVAAIIKDILNDFLSKMSAQKNQRRGSNCTVKDLNKLVAASKGDLLDMDK